MNPYISITSNISVVFHSPSAIFIRPDPIGFPSHSTHCFSFVSSLEIIRNSFIFLSPDQDHSIIFFPVLSAFPTLIARIESIIFPGHSGRTHGSVLRHDHPTLLRNHAFHPGSYPSMIGSPLGIRIVPRAPSGVFSEIGPLQRVSTASSLNPVSVSVSFTAMMVVTFWFSGVDSVARRQLVFTIVYS